MKTVTAAGEFVILLLVLVVSSDPFILVRPKLPWLTYLGMQSVQAESFCPSPMLDPCEIK